MEKKLKDYIGLYWECKFLDTGAEPDDNIISLDSITSWGAYDKDGNEIRFDELKPILRPLSSMTKEEMEECGNMIYDFSNDPDLNKWQPSDFEMGLAPEQFLWLLSKHFDLFGLIDAGLAIDKSTLLNPAQ